MATCSMATAARPCVASRRAAARVPMGGTGVPTISATGTDTVSICRTPAWRAPHAVRSTCAQRVTATRRESAGASSGRTASPATPATRVRAGRASKGSAWVDRPCAARAERVNQPPAVYPLGGRAVHDRSRGGAPSPQPVSLVTWPVTSAGNSGTGLLEVARPLAASHSLPRTPRLVTAPPFSTSRVVA